MIGGSVLQKNGEEVIDKTCSSVNAMIISIMIEPEEWPLMKRESPEIWKRIEELEWLGIQSDEDTGRDMRALLKNYERLFARRMFRRRKSA